MVITVRELSQSKISANEGSASDGQDPATLIGEIQRGNHEAEIAFLKIYSRGIRYILKRRVEPQNLAACHKKVQSTMLDRIRNGWLPEDGRIAPLIYEAMAACGIAPSEKASPPPSTATVELIKTALHGLGAREREAVTRYYLRGEDATEVMDSLGFTAESFQSLIARLKEVAAGLPRGKAAAAGGS